MAAYTEEQFVNAAYELMQQRGMSVDASIIPRLRVGIRPALERLSSMVAASKDRQIRNLLRRQIGSITVSSGSADLSTLLSDSRPLLKASWRTIDIRVSSRKMQMLPDRSSLDNDRPSAFTYGAVENVTLYTTAADGSYPVTANFVETDITQLRPELEPLLFDELIGATPIAQAA